MTQLSYLSPYFSKLFHIRPVTQTDVYRADAREIPRIFQVMTLLISSLISSLKS